MNIIIPFKSKKLTFNPIFRNTKVNEIKSYRMKVDWYIQYVYTDSNKLHNIAKHTYFATAWRGGGHTGREWVCKFRFGGPIKTKFC